jgi:hypothetical protein
MVAILGAGVAGGDTAAVLEYNVEYGAVVAGGLMEVGVIDVALVG